MDNEISRTRQSLPATVVSGGFSALCCSLRSFSLAIFLFFSSEVLAQNIPLPSPLQLQMMQGQQPQPQIQQPQKKQDPCAYKADYYEEIFEQIRSKKNPAIISQLPECFSYDRKLILKAVLIDPEQFQYAAETLQEDQIFVMRLLKISPNILPFATPEIRADEDFMERATYITRDALQYASWQLLDNILFMQKMIKIDSRNYKFASDRIKSIRSNAEAAFSDNGLLLEFAPEKIKDDMELVKMALKSNSSALPFASERLQKNADIIELAQQKTSVKSVEELHKFLQKNYLVESGQKNIGKVLGNKMKFAPKNKIIDRNYVTKWQNYLDFSSVDNNGHISEERRLIAAESRNYQISWHKDFKNYPTLIKKIEKFFHNHGIPANTVDNLSTTYLWKIKDKPLTLAFNLYLLRDSTDLDLGSNFVDATSLTAIVELKNEHWEMTIIEVILDSEIKVDVPFENGHKKYVIWDLYKVDKNDKNPKIIYKVEDKFGDYFETFEEQNGGKYQMIDTFDPSKKPS